MPQRYKDYQEIKMAQGAPEHWIIRDNTPKYADWSFGGGRPFNCRSNDCDRWHAGIDLRCKGNSVVVLPELCTIEAVDRGWSKGSKAVFARTATGLFLVFGGTIRNSGNEWNVREGDELPAGSPIGRVLGSYGMIHIETYVDDAYRMTNSRWYVSEPPPEGLLNPLNYVQHAAGHEMTLQTWTQIRYALRLLGYGPLVSGRWDEEDTVALLEAQEDLALDPDGVWGPATHKRVREELARLKLDPFIGPPIVPPEGRPGDRPRRPVDVPDTTTKWLFGGLAGLAVLGGGYWMMRRSSR